MAKLQQLSFLMCAVVHLVAGVPFLKASNSGGTGRVDTHIHAIPLSYSKVLVAAGLTDIPTWSLSATKSFLQETGASIGILSISAPGVSVVGVGDEARSLARSLNVEMASYLSDKNSTAAKLGFFGTLPDWQDVEGTLAELDYLYTEQKLCNGVAIFTTYGGKLLGDPAYAPIWARLQKYKALIFIHPAGLDVVPQLIGPGLPQYVIDFLWTTTRTATDLVMTGTLSAAPDVDVILAHAGGALPYAGTRAIASLLAPSVADLVPIDIAEAQRQFGRFYYDTALSTSTAQLDGMLDFAGAAQVGFGSDFPYAPTQVVDRVADALKQFQLLNPRGPLLANPVLRRNSLKLLNKHSLGRLFR
ncbi:amidohydrolase 2 [Drepanopeziza brunnea f. sp. 'multigermtubi' MB_m1]|uniref:Amidohydrolase 2 n=2 Tax=Drepanopeziza brunnea f. sp. 'multigermtubi' TaxID=698441 RepID=K1WPQ8_MARBU|nr:amidohydrolase 2 [Drepanopeziza brunnea f. sp. 'multigermtubi' MB_m1]EKD14966.1 amidohydrolase 2 [Drepanopeziza brunnea f. sp. 'multigermtubi' MB_m1]